MCSKGPTDKGSARAGIVRFRFNSAITKNETDLRDDDLGCFVRSGSRILRMMGWKQL